MLIGPLEPAPAHPSSPLKSVQVRQSASTQPIVFGTATAYSIGADAVRVSCDVPIYAGDVTPEQVAQNRAILAQLIELGGNDRWAEALAVICRGDGASDAQDGWYVLESVDGTETGINRGYSDASVSLIKRASLGSSVGIRAFTGAQQNSANLGGTTLVAYPAGVDLTGEYPLTSATFTGRNGSVGVVENPGVDMRAPVSSHTDLMQKGRCAVYDENSAGTVSTEIFASGHRNFNGYTRVTNDLLRYTLHPGDNAPLVEVWNSGAWLTVGTYQLQAYNGSTYTVLPLRSFTFDYVGPEEVRWAEVRWDSTALAYVRVTNRIRRGSRLIESSIVCGSGLGLTGQQSIGLVAAATPTRGASADGTGVAWTVSGSAALPGFAYLTGPAFASATATNLCASGLSIPAGSGPGRIGLIAGVQDAQYTALGSTAALYATKWASVNRTAVRQRLLVEAS